MSIEQLDVVLEVFQELLILGEVFPIVDDVSAVHELLAPRIMVGLGVTYEHYVMGIASFHLNSLLQSDSLQPMRVDLNSVETSSKIILLRPFI